LDTSFGNQGKVTTAIGKAADIGNSVAIQTDGKIVAAGKSHNGTNWDFAVVRYLANGVIDQTFGGTGKVVNLVGTGNDVGNGVAIQKDGKIVVAGETYNGSNLDFAVVRYNTNGSLDTSFGGTGKVTIGYIDSTYGNDIHDDYACCVALQGDGKIVVAGLAGGYYNYNGTGDDIAVVRYNSNGTLDTTFSGGRVRTNIGGGSFGSKDVARSVTVQGDGKIVVAGDHNDSYTGTTFFALARYNADGSSDNDFGGFGIVTTRISDNLYGGKCVGRSMALQKDGKIVVAGQLLASNYDFAMARYNTYGTLDTSFNSTGIVKTDFGNGDDDGFGVAVQADGKILVAGMSVGDFGLARYNTNGTLDAAFGSAGKVKTDFGSGFDSGTCIALQSDGRIVVAGKSSNNTDDFSLARYRVQQPDACIGTRPAPTGGSNVYNITGAGQTQVIAVSDRQNKTVYVDIQNDGAVSDRLLVKGGRGNESFSVKYLVGKTNVTSKVLAGTYSTAKLPPGGKLTLKVIVTGNSSAIGKKHRLLIRSISTVDVRGQDAALIKVSSTGH
jgi:uncharacterized delta-60 repeat protein